jgi:general secretion pathway protein I
MTCQRPQRLSGFTIIEVIIAMLVIALGIGSLLTTLASAAENVGRLRDKSFAEWVALNRISETRLARPRPGAGVTTGEIEFAGTKWVWKQEIIDQEIAGMLRIDVSVARATVAVSLNAAGEEEFPALSKAYGFLGTEVGSPSGIDPDWSLPPPQQGPNPP